jgi:hypothetical protein
MIAEAIGWSLAEVGELSIEELQIWSHWFAFKTEEARKAAKEAQRKRRR